MPQSRTEVRLRRLSHHVIPGWAAVSSPPPVSEYTPAATWPRADAHIHLVPADGCGWAVARAEGGVVYDEPVMYDALAQKHGVVSALVASVDSRNNHFIAAAAKQFPWCRPAAWFSPSTLTLEALKALVQTHDAATFCGIAMYLGPADNEALLAVDGAVWQWLDRRRWIVSCNDSGEGWGAWASVLRSCPTLRLLASHLGSPDPTEVDARLGGVFKLAEFPEVRVKLSGFYGTTTPATHDFPHRQAWGYVVALLESFGAARLCFGSDFSPCLQHLSFQQTVDIFRLLEAEGILSPEDRRQIEGANLLELLDDAAAAAAHHVCGAGFGSEYLQEPTGVSVLAFGTILAVTDVGNHGVHLFDTSAAAAGQQRQQHLCSLGGGEAEGGLLLNRPYSSVVLPADETGPELLIVGDRNHHQLAWLDVASRSWVQRTGSEGTGLGQFGGPRAYCTACPAGPISCAQRGHITVSEPYRKLTFIRPRLNSHCCAGLLHRWPRASP